jgi:hypothetical protein
MSSVGGRVSAWQRSCQPRAYDLAPLSRSATDFLHLQVSRTLRNTFATAFHISHNVRLSIRLLTTGTQTQNRRFGRSKDLTGVQVHGESLTLDVCRHNGRD